MIKEAFPVLGLPLSEDQVLQAKQNREDSTGLRVLDSIDHVIEETTKTPKRRVMTALGMGALGAITAAINTKNPAAAVAFSEVSAFVAGVPFGHYIRPSRFMELKEQQQKLTQLAKVPVNTPHTGQQLINKGAEFLQLFEGEIPSEELCNWTNNTLGKDFVNERDKRYGAMEVLLAKAAEKELGYRKRKGTARNIFEQAQQKAQVLRGSPEVINREILRDTYNMLIGGAGVALLTVGINEMSHNPNFASIANIADDIAIPAIYLFAPYVKRIVQALTPEIHADIPKNGNGHTQEVWNADIIKSMHNPENTSLNISQLPVKVRFNHQR